MVAKPGETAWPAISTQLRDALRIFQNGEESARLVEPRVTMAKGSGNVEGSIITLDRFLRDLDAHAEAADPFARIPGRHGPRSPRAEYPPAQVGKTPGKVPKQVLEIRARHSSLELFANDAFHSDVEALIRPRHRHCDRFTDRI